jgi:hypothetical protein
VLATEHLLGFGGVDLVFERVERLAQVVGDVLAALRPLQEYADVVELFREAVAELEILGEPPLALQGLLRLSLVVPEIGGGDLLFELR